jgi:large subunit ribosomal protein L21
LYAVVNVAGYQFRVSPDETLMVPRLAQGPGDKVTLDQVLLVGEGDDVRVGRPTVPGASVEAEIVAHEKGEKVRVFKMKRRKGFRQMRGHRQPLTRIRVVGVHPGDGGSEGE